MSHALHPKVEEVIHDYLQAIQRFRPGYIEGFYLYGSIALGDFSLPLSDIDFIVFSSERLEEVDIEQIGMIHHQIAKKHRHPKMSGIYLTWNDLGQLPEQVQPYPYYHDGKMYSSGYFELSLVTWYQLKQVGIPLIGPPPSELPFSVDWEELIIRMHQNLNSYWADWIDKSKHTLLNSLRLYFSRSQVEWGVLGISRLFYTFREHQIVSKREAGEYALKTVPKEWHQILQDAILFRQGEHSLYSSKSKRKADALGYMEYIMQACHNMF